MHQLGSQLSHRSNHAYPNILAIASLAIFLSACQNIPRLAATKEGQSHASGTKVKVIVAQKELIKEYRQDADYLALATVVISMSGMGVIPAGIIGGIAGVASAPGNAARAKQAEEAVQPIRAALGDFNFDDNFRQAIDSKFRTTQWLQAQESELFKNPETNIAARSPEAPILYLVTSYSIAYNIGVLKVQVFAQQVPRRIDPPGGPKAMLAHKAVVKPIYRNSISFTAKLHGRDDKEISSAWQKGEEKSLIATVLEQAANDIAEQLSLDLSTTPSMVKQQLADKKLPLYPNTSSGKAFGRVVAKSENRTVIRNKDGSLSIIVQL